MTLDTESFICSPSASRNTDEFPGCARCSARYMDTREIPGRRGDKCAESKCGRCGNGSDRQVLGSTNHEFYAERGHRRVVPGE